MKRIVFVTLFAFICAIAGSQTSDSLIVESLRGEGVSFSDNNSVTLLMSGQEKFDDMFSAIRQARSSVHLEYFNFRNDSIASLLFDILAEKAAQGVEVRALFDGFGNSGVVRIGVAGIFILTADVDGAHRNIRFSRSAARSEQHHGNQHHRSKHE